MSLLAQLDQTCLNGLRCDQFVFGAFGNRKATQDVSVEPLRHFTSFGGAELFKCVSDAFGSCFSVPADWPECSQVP